MRARIRAARLHPAARGRYEYRLGMRRMVSIGVWLVRRGVSATEALCTWALHVLAEAGGIALPPNPRPARPTLAELAARVAERVAERVAIVAADTRDHLAVARTRDSAEIRTESVPCRAPGTPVSLPWIPARPHMGNPM